MQTLSTEHPSHTAAPSPPPEAPAADAFAARPAVHRQHPYRPVPAAHARTYVLRPPPMAARPRELAALAIMVALVDFALLRRDTFAPSGVTLGIALAAIPVVLLLAARKLRFGFRLSAALLACISLALRTIYEPSVLAIGCAGVAIFSLTVAARDRRAFLTDVVQSAVQTLLQSPRRVVGVLRGFQRLFAGRPGRNFAQVLIPLALVGAFTGIFALANPVVGRVLGALSQTIRLPSTLHLSLWVAAGLAFVPLLRPSLLRSKASEEATDPGEASATSKIIARNALAALNVLFAGYNALDAAYLWAGSPPPGVSERLYAHQGAAWLTVALLLLTVVVGVFFRGSLAHDASAKTSRMLAYVWLGQGLVLALGTYRRLGIHITTSGLSSIRILGMIGTTLVVVGLVQVGLKLHQRRSFAWLLRRQSDALVCGALAFALLPTHRISADINVQRTLEHRYQAMVHLEEEVAEAESAAALLPLLDHDDERVRQGTAALLLQRMKSLPVDGKLSLGNDWASARAGAKLAAARDKIEDTLDDADPIEAIRYFEYIRNSSIEGEIADSEIALVPYAKRRVHNAIAQWVNGHTGGPVGSIPYAARVELDGTTESREALIGIRETSREPRGFDGAELVGLRRIDRDHMEAELLAVRGPKDLSPRKVTITLQRTRSDYTPWIITRERGTERLLYAP